MPRGRRISLTVAGLVVTFCLLEGLVRFCVLGPGTLFAADPDIGKVPMRGTHVLWGTEGYGRTAYSGNGEIATPFTGRPSVVVIGDSHTEALQVDDAAKFVSVAETELRRRGQVFDLHNLGFSGGTIADYVRLGPAVMSRYRPVAVVIQLSPEDFGAETFEADHLNRFEKESDGALRLVHRDLGVGSPSLGARVKHAFALVNYSELRFLRIAERRAHAASAPGAESDAAPAQALQWDTVPRELGLLRQAYPDVPVILLLLPFVPRVQTGTVITDDPDYQRLLATIRSTIHGYSGWQVLDPLSAFQSLAERRMLPRGFANSRPGTGHLNTIGHRVVGHLLADALSAIRPSSASFPNQDVVAGSVPDPPRVR